MPQAYTVKHLSFTGGLVSTLEFKPSLRDLLAVRLDEKIYMNVEACMGTRENQRENFIFERNFKAAVNSCDLQVLDAVEYSILVD